MLSEYVVTFLTSEEEFGSVTEILLPTYLELSSFFFVGSEDEFRVKVRVGRC